MRHILGEMPSCQHQKSMLCSYTKWFSCSGAEAAFAPLEGTHMALVQPLPFGALLKRERLARRLTQEALAERAGLSARAISDLERGVNRTPRKETLRLLADALELSPDGRSRLEAALRWPAVPSLSTPTPARWASSDPRHIPLAGRARELARLEQHLGGEGPPLLLLAGEPGIGKSRLLEEGTRLASAHGWTVLAGSCHRQSGQEPYTPLLSALAGYLHQQPLVQGRTALEGCAWLVRLLPELAERGLVPNAPWKLPPEQERRLMFAAVERFLTNLAGPAGTLLVLDDLQWAGTDALELLAALVRSAVQAPVRILGSFRSTEVRAEDPLGVLVADLASAELVAQIDLLPLAPEEAAGLLHLLFDISAGDVALAEQVLNRTGGVPFFLVSCAQAVRQNRMAGAAIQDVPWTVAQSIRQRVAALPVATRELLGAAAVMGRYVPGVLLHALALQPEREALVALEASCQARLLLETEDGFQFPHDLIREVILADVSAARRRLLHRLVAEALEQRPGAPPLEYLAYHWVAAGDREKAAVALEQAGDHAQAIYAFAEAEGAYRGCLAQLESLGSLQKLARLYEKLGNALTIQDRYEEAIAVFEQAVEGYRIQQDQEGQWRVLAQIGLVHGHRGTSKEGLAELEPVVETMELGLVSSGLAALYAALAFLAMSSSDHAKQLAFAEQAVQLAQALKDEEILIQATYWMSVAFLALGRPQESLPPLLETIRMAEQVGDLWNLSKALNSLSGRHLLRGEFEQSQAYVERACAAAEPLGWSALMAYLWFCRGEVAWYRGEWTKAKEHYEHALALGRESGGIWGVGFPGFGRGHLALIQGQAEVAVQHFAEATALAERGHNLSLLRLIQLALAEAELIAGQPEAALARLRPLLDQSDQEELDVTELLPVLAWARLDAGESDEAVALLSTCLRRAREQEARIVVPNALRVQARRERQLEYWDEAERMLDEALALCRSMPYPYAEAKTLYEYGLLHLQQGQSSQARERFEAALAICDHLGEWLYAQQLEAALAALEQMA